MRVAYFGTWERDYPRNEQVVSSLRLAGVDVEVVHEDVWRNEQKFSFNPMAAPRLLGAEFRLASAQVGKDVEALVVGYPGQFDVWSARRHGRPVVFNAMVSLYDTFVEDRARFSPASIPARILRGLDRWSFRAADLLVADTRANAAYMAEIAGLHDVAVCYLGAEERLFREAWKRGDRFHVLFVGKPAPLHGLDLIIEAARLLPAVPFRIVGTGQVKDVFAAKPDNVEHVPWVEYERVPEEYARAGCALGIFGPSGKAQRVIPHKVFQAMAVGTPLVTADTEASRELLTDGHDALLVERSPEALADAICRIRDSPELAEKLGREGRSTFGREASEHVLGLRWRTVIEQAIARHG